MAKWSKSNRVKRAITKWKRHLKVAESQLEKDKVNPQYQRGTYRNNGNKEYLEKRIVNINEAITKLQNEIL